MPDFTTTVSNDWPIHLKKPTLSPHILLPTLLAKTLLKPGCSNNPTTPDASQTIVEISVEPNPVTNAQNEITFAVSATYSITIQEVGGFGGEIQFISAVVYEFLIGRQVALNYYDGVDFVVYQGGKRLEFFGQLVVF
jgi:hypothetical protein